MAVQRRRVKATIWVLSVFAAAVVVLLAGASHLIPDHPNGISVKWYIKGFTLPDKSWVVLHESSSLGEHCKVESQLTYKQFHTEMHQILTGLGFKKCRGPINPPNDDFWMRYTREPDDQIVMHFHPIKLCSCQKYFWTKHDPDTEWDYRIQFEKIQPR